MKTGENDDIEKGLRSLKLKPAPPGLREKIVATAQKRKEDESWTTPLLQWCLAVCAAVLLAVFVVDGLVTRSQARHLQAMLDGSRPAMSRGDDGTPVLAEVLGEPAVEKLIARSEADTARQARAEQIHREEILKELLLEDFDGNESKKNIR
jgi:hypothetical protein